jgi:hypothetical protein
MRIAATLTLGLTACGGAGVTAPQTATPSPAATVPTVGCSAWPGSEAFFTGSPVPDPSQENACFNNVRPRFEQVVAARQGTGIEVTYVTVDADARTLCEATYFNGRWRAASCGGRGPGRTFISGLTFPVHVRIVGWDERGCLAEPVCLTVR